MRTALVALAVVAVPLAATAAIGSPRTRIVDCDESIATTRFPYLGSSNPQNRYRLVLDAASVPPAYQQQVVPTHERPWRYHRKAGIVIRAGGEKVTVTVPETWRSRASITWGNGGHRVFSSVRFGGCGSNPKSGNAYAGGFYLAVPSACVPLLIRVGRRSAIIRFGIGRRCN